MADSIHFSVQVIGRSAGRSATAAAAYRSGTRIADERTGEVHDYSRKGGVVFSEVLLPDHAPRFLSDRSTLWNAVERSEKSKAAQLCREINFALPRELTRDENEALARDYIRRTFVDAGMIADWAFHDPGNGNPHAHVMLTMREVREDGTFKPKVETRYLCRFDMTGDECYMTPAELKDGADGYEKVYLYKNGQRLTQSEAREMGLDPTKDRKRKQPVQVDAKPNDWDEPTKAEQWREAYARMQNQALDRAGLEKRVDHRSFERRRVERIPQVHLGAKAHRMERKGVRTDLGDKNRAIAMLNEELKKPELPQELRREILEEGYAIKSMSVEYRGQVEDRARGVLRRVVDRVRELAQSLLRRQPQQEAHRKPAEEPQTVEYTVEMQNLVHLYRQSEIACREAREAVLSPEDRVRLNNALHDAEVAYETATRHEERARAEYDDAQRALDGKGIFQRAKPLEAARDAAAAKLDAASARKNEAWREYSDLWNAQEDSREASVDAARAAQKMRYCEGRLNDLMADLPSNARDALVRKAIAPSAPTLAAALEERGYAQRAEIPSREQPGENVADEPNMSEAFYERKRQTLRGRSEEATAAADDMEERRQRSGRTRQRSQDYGRDL